MDTRFNRKYLTAITLGAFLSPFAGICQADEGNMDIPTVCLQITMSGGQAADRPVYSRDDFVAQRAAIQVAWARVHRFDTPEPFAPTWVANAEEARQYAARPEAVQVASIDNPEQILRDMPTASGGVAPPHASPARLVTTSDEAARYVAERVSYAQRVATADTLHHCPDSHD
jgi:hypothetical protein